MGSLGYSKHINLQLGWPTPRLFPSKALIDAAQATLSNDEIAAQALVYGPDPGHERLRKALATWLNGFYSPESGRTEPENLFITNGASGALAVILSRFTHPAITRRIWMIEPTYFLACPSFQDAGFEGRLCGVPEDDEGIDIEFLRRGILKANQETSANVSALESSRHPKVYQHVVYAVPTFSNPSAKTMSLRRREQLVELAREFDTLIITDDVYDWLRWPAEESAVDCRDMQKPPPRLVDVDRSMPGMSSWGNTVSNGSFSKVVAPGVRVGWVDSSPNIARELCKVGPVNSGGCQSHLSSMFICELLASGTLENHVQSTLIPIYRKRYMRMLESIKLNLYPLGFKISSSHDIPSQNEPTESVAGGFFLYIDFPSNSPAVEEVAAIALADYNLRIAHGGMMLVKGDETCIQRAKATFGRGARLCWAWHEEDEIDEGIRRLAAAFRDALTRA
ncbi:hypothetical protein FDECE_4050 [Fusarium decemcellulare]|nr:hypothetical protein FDECE_4050 [Fusarium decemcellulare]